MGVVVILETRLFDPTDLLRGITRRKTEEVTLTVFAAVTVKDAFQNGEQNVQVHKLVVSLIAHVVMDMERSPVRANKLGFTGLEILKELSDEQNRSVIACRRRENPLTRRAVVLSQATVVVRSPAFNATTTGVIDVNAFAFKLNAKKVT
jgi:hypothetical protein